MTTETKAREIDTQLAALHDQLAKVGQRLSSVIDTLQCAVHDRKQWIGRRSHWTLSTSQVEAQAAQLVADGNDDDLSLGRGRIAKALADIAQARQDGDKVRGQMAELDGIYRADPWTRYFPCLSNNGHIHASLGCHTLRAETLMAWTPELSGKPVETAVAELGEALCTVCFPAAPAAWTAKTLGDVKREQVAADRATAKAARDAVKAAKNLTEAEQFRDHRGDRVTTVAAAKQILRDEVELRYYYGRGPHPWHAESVEAARKAREVLLSRGVEAAELDTIVARAEKKHAKFVTAS